MPRYFVPDPTPPPPEPIPATGVRPGTPGTWVPADATPPADLAAAAGDPIEGGPSVWPEGAYVLLGDGSQVWAFMTQPDTPASFTAGVAPTAVTVVEGAAGHFEDATSGPAGAAADVGSLAALPAVPATAWATGSLVYLVDGTTAYWDGTAWQVGVAP